MIKPVQRLCKYPLLLRELLKFTPESHPDHAALQAAYIKIEEAVSHVNEAKRKKENSEKMRHISQILNDDTLELIQPSRNFIKEGEVENYKLKNEKLIKTNLYLFNDFVIVAKPGRWKKKIKKQFPNDTIVYNLEDKAEHNLSNAIQITNGSRSAFIVFNSPEIKSEWIASFNTSQIILKQKSSISIKTEKPIPPPRTDILITEEMTANLKHAEPKPLSLHLKQPDLTRSSGHTRNKSGDKWLDKYGGNQPAIQVTTVDLVQGSSMRVQVANETVLNQPVVQSTELETRPRSASKFAVVELERSGNAASLVISPEHSNQLQQPEEVEIRSNIVTNPPTLEQVGYRIITDNPMEVAARATGEAKRSSLKLDTQLVQQYMNEFNTLKVEPKPAAEPVTPTDKWAAKYADPSLLSPKNKPVAKPFTRATSIDKPAIDAKPFAKPLARGATIDLSNDLKPVPTIPKGGGLIASLAQKPVAKPKGFAAAPKAVSAKPVGKVPVKAAPVKAAPKFPTTQPKPMPPTENKPAEIKKEEVIPAAQPETKPVEKK